MKLEIVKNLNSSNIDKKRLDYYRRYASEYYNDKFRPNQGTEVILDMIKKFAPGGKWLDIGAGPATLFWSLMMPKLTSINCSEITHEGIIVLDEFFQSDFIPECYKDIIQLYWLSDKKLTQNRGLPREYYLFDALKEWPELPSRPYDIITAFGVYGLCRNATEYVQSFAHPRASLVGGKGVLMGANWVRSKEMVAKHGGDNSYLRKSLVDEAAKKYNYKLKFLSEESIQGDKNYDRVVIWCLQA